MFLCQEEDLFSMTYGLPLYGDGDEKCLSFLNAVEETICRQLRACKAPSSKKRVLEGSYPITFSNIFIFFFCSLITEAPDIKMKIGFRLFFNGEQQRKISL